MTTYTRNTLTGSLAPVNNELEKIEVSLREKLDRNPSVAQNNEMLDDLDMNSNRIINYPDAVNDSDLITKGQVASLAPVQTVNGQTGNVSIPTQIQIDNGVVFDNIAEMKSSSLEIGQLVKCKRYYALGELVDGLEFEVVANGTGVDDGGSFHDLTNGNQAKLLSLSYINVSQFGAVGDGSNSTVSFTNAIAFGLPVVFSGTHEVLNIPLLSNTSLKGISDIAGNKAKLTQITSASGSQFCLSANIGSGGTPDPADNIVNILLSNFTVEGKVATEGFEEQAHLVSLSAVTGVNIEYVDFIGFKGDGIYVASSNVSATERHNIDINIRYCKFDGVNRDQRNAISVIDGKDVTIEYNEFLNCSRSNMPGPVDFEPNAFTFPIIENIKVINNTFRGCGGNVGQIAFQIPNTLIRPISKIIVAGNTFEDYVGTGPDIRVITGKTITSTTAPNQVSISDNKGDNCFRPFDLRGLRGLRIVNNQFQNYDQGALLGFSDGTNDRIYEVFSSGNTYDTCGTIGKKGFELFTVSNFTSLSDRFIDCGDGTAGSYAIDLNTGTSNNIKFKGLEVYTPSGKTLDAIIKEAGHTLTASTNEFLDCDVSGLRNMLLAYKNNGIQEFNVFTAEITPNAFPYGISRSIVNSALGTMPVGGFTVGELEVHKLNSLQTTWFQDYHPRGNTSGGQSTWYRRYSDAAGTSWQGWYKHTGVLDA